MAWKSEFMALGDAEGAVSIWEWRTRHFRPLPHLRSPIKKVRFAPGKNNMKLLVLHMDGVDIWDVKGNGPFLKIMLSFLKFYLKLNRQRTIGSMEEFAVPRSLNGFGCGLDGIRPPPSSLFRWNSTNIRPGSAEVQFPNGRLYKRYPLDSVSHATHHIPSHQERIAAEFARSKFSHWRPQFTSGRFS